MHSALPLLCILLGGLPLPASHLSYQHDLIRNKLGIECTFCKTVRLLSTCMHVSLLALPFRSCGRPRGCRPVDNARHDRCVIDAAAATACSVKVAAAIACA